jgi:signal transduction histidine kinase
MVSIASTIIATATPLLVGREMRARRERAEELQRKVAEAERERKESARRAVAEERARIARELHDVVAHQMTVMTIQADGARRVADGADPRVIEALDTIQATGHSALAEMRRVVGLLRENETGSPELAPLPTLDDLGTLVEQVRSSTGVPVDLEVEGAVRPLAEGVELSAYRIVQESLTNAVRHGGPNVSADVAVCYGDDGLDVLVVDNGRGAAAAAGNGGGHGLVGMRERVAVLGGSFEAGPRPGGGYRVHASIPYQT